MKTTVLRTTSDNLDFKVCRTGSEPRNAKEAVTRILGATILQSINVVCLSSKIAVAVVGENMV
jgi:hypothetical protein